MVSERAALRKGLAYLLKRKCQNDIALMLAFASLATHKRKLPTAFLSSWSRQQIHHRNLCGEHLAAANIKPCQCHCKRKRQRDLVENICIKKWSLLWRHLESLCRRIEASGLHTCGLSSVPGCLAQARVIKPPRMLFTTIYSQFYEAVTNIMS